MFPWYFIMLDYWLEWVPLQKADFISLHTDISSFHLEEGVFFVMIGEGPGPWLRQPGIYMIRVWAFVIRLEIWLHYL